MVLLPFLVGFLSPGQATTVLFLSPWLVYLKPTFTKTEFYMHMVYVFGHSRNIIFGDSTIFRNIYSLYFLMGLIVFHPVNIPK